MAVDVKAIFRPNQTLQQLAAGLCGNVLGCGFGLFVCATVKQTEKNVLFV